MKIYIGLEQFKPWSGAIETWRRIKNENLLGQFESILDDIYPDGLSDTELNDLLWFEDETVLHDWLGLDTYDTIENEISNLQDELEELEYEFVR